MYKSRREEEDKPVLSKAVFSVLAGLLTGYIITLIGLFIIALLLLQLHLSEQTVEIAIIVLYVLSSFTSGFLIGKLMKTRKFLWGMVEGLAYYLILFVLSMIMQKNMVMDGRELMTVFCICMGGGMLGGMLS